MQPIKIWYGLRRRYAPRNDGGGKQPHFRSHWHAFNGEQKMNLRQLVAMLIEKREGPGLLGPAQ